MCFITYLLNFEKHVEHRFDGVGNRLIKIIAYIVACISVATSAASEYKHIY